MSLGIFWSLLNPLVMMSVMWFVFTKIFPNNRIPNFAVFVLCGIVPYNFFSIAWGCGTTSVLESAPLIKRVPIPRWVLPVASVIGTFVHLSAQLALLLVTVLLTYGVNRYWFWLIFLWACQLVFVGGLSLIFSALNVYVRDVRYVVESANVVLFWVVPIFYPFSAIAPEFREIYQFNPVAALVLASRFVLLDGVAPPTTLLWKLALTATVTLVFGLWFFRQLDRRLYNYL
jgi:ABC-type polysaccharide/polyol phosphate export permease